MNFNLLDALAEPSTRPPPHKKVCIDDNTQAFRVGDSVYIDAKILQKRRPMGILLYMRRYLIARKWVRPYDDAPASHRCRQSLCTLITPPYNPEYIMCAETGMVHICRNHCQLAAENTVSNVGLVCPLTGIVKSRTLTEVDARFSDHHTLARADAEMDLGISIRAEIAPSKADESHCERIRKHEVLVVKARDLLKEILFSKARRDHDAKIVEQARMSLARILSEHIRRQEAEGKYFVSGMFVMAELEQCVARLRKQGILVPQFDLDNYRQIAATVAVRAVTWWLEFCDRYAPGAAGDTNVPRTIKVNGIQYSFTYHVIATMYYLSTAARGETDANLAAIVPAPSSLTVHGYTSMACTKATNAFSIAISLCQS